MAHIKSFCATYFLILWMFFFNADLKYITKCYPLPFLEILFVQLELARVSSWFHLLTTKIEPGVRTRQACHFQPAVSFIDFVCYVSGLPSGVKTTLSQTQVLQALLWQSSYSHYTLTCNFLFHSCSPFIRVYIIYNMIRLSGGERWLCTESTSTTLC